MRVTDSPPRGVKAPQSDRLHIVNKQSKVGNYNVAKSDTGRAGRDIEIIDIFSEENGGYGKRLERRESAPWMGAPQICDGE